MHGARRANVLFLSVYEANPLPIILPNGFNGCRRPAV